MKKHWLLFVFLFVTNSLFAQQKDVEKAEAMKLVVAHQKTIGLTDQQLSELSVSSSYYRPESGIRMVYLQQTYQSIPVFNKMLVLAFKDGRPVSHTGEMLAYISQKVNSTNGIPVVSVLDALRAVYTDLNIHPTSSPKIISSTPEMIVVDGTGVSAIDMIATKAWLPLGDKEVKLTWQIEIAPLKTSDHLLVRVDALTGKVIDKNNYTVYEKFDEIIPGLKIEIEKGGTDQSLLQNSPQVVSSATYRVIPYPAESPIHAGGASALKTDPWTWAPGNATTNLWNYDGTTYYDSTRGNNVYAQEDRDNSNTTYGRTAISSTAQPSLTIDYTPDYTQAPTITANQRFATANLFYWNNLMHDILYKYGFDEVSGNFQATNMGRGGLGNDFVVADAQDAGGTNNANFSTPVDGSLPRMQMYIFNYTTPNRDGDLDNGVITHEYGHGLSNRLTGGPANSSCLSNLEEGGEGWSDYVALMTTTNWATASVNDGALAHPIGTYVLGQATTGAGIRTYPYSTNMTINPWTYGMMTASGGEVHKIGEIWCAALWDMTWELIAMDGINPNLFNLAGGGGNTAALKLVLEGMRLQPCSPGYIDARNAILKADSLFYNGKYSCAIWKAFARRGMGRFASQGSSNSTIDQVADYTDNGGISMRLTQSVTQQQEGLNVTYTTTVNAGSCGAVSNYILRDTLPSNVTYVSGGTYDSTNRVVSFPVNVGVGGSQSYSFTVTINQGSYYAPIGLLDETVPSTTISSFWTKSSTTTTLWTTSTAQSTSAPNSLFSANLTTVSDQKLETTNAFTIPANPPYFTFMGYINSEASWDGGVVEISTNNGTTWTDLGAQMISGGYTGALSSSTNPLSGRSAFNGNGGGFVKTTINLSSFAGQSVKIRFRFGSDASVAGTGWWVDDIQMKNIAQVNIRSNLFNATNVRTYFSDTSTIILQGSSCVAGNISSQPSSVTLCAGASASFTVAAYGTALTYQWQQSTNGGSSFANISGATANSLSLTSLTTASNNYQYRCVINGTCTVNLISNEATLLVNALPNNAVAVNASRCGAGTVAISASSGAGETVDWYADLNGNTLLQAGNNVFVTGAINTTTSYYALTRNTTTGCLAASRTQVTATVKSTSNSSTNITACNSYAWNGNSYTTSGVYTFTTTNTVGCDSVATLNLTIKKSTTSTQSISACNSYAWNGNTYTTSGVYTFTTTNAVGCDSVATLNLTIKKSTTSTQSISACSSYAWNGNTYTTSGVYTFTTTNAVGCDSVATLNLTIKKSTTSTQSISACNSYAWNGNTYTTSGVYTFATTNAAGCDSVATLHLAISNLATSTSVVSACGHYTWNGNDYSTSGTYTFATQAQSGCDSMATLQLTILQTSSSLSVVNACDSYDWNGNTYTVSGTYSFTSTNAAGCDSVASLQLTLGKKSLSTTALGICSSQLPYHWNGLSCNAGGLYVVTLVNASGCDSLAKLLLDVAQVPQVYAVTGGGTYPTGGAGMVVGLSGSEIGVQYQLLFNGTAIGSTVAGTGSAITFGNQTSEGVYSVTAAPGSLCALTMGGSVSISISSAPPNSYAVSGGGYYCASTSGVAIGLSGSEINVSYQLMRSNGTVTVGTAIQGTGAAISFGNQTIADTYIVKAINNVNGLNAMMNGSATVSVISSTVAAATPGTITGPAAVCIYINQGTAIYTIRKVANATSYVWTVPAGASIVGNATDTMVMVAYTAAFTSGNISVVAKNACFNNSTSTARTLAVSKTIPAAPSSIVGLIDVCAAIGGDATSIPVIYTINKVANASSYLWAVPTGVSIISGQGDTAVYLTFASSFVSGNITVQSLSPCGNSTTTKSLTVYKRVAATPAAIQKEFSPSVVAVTSICGLVSEIYKVKKVTYATSYNWSMSVGAYANISHLNPAGANDTAVVVYFLPGITKDTLRVSAVTPCAASAQKTVVLSAVNTPPAVSGLTGTATPCIGNVLAYTATATLPTSSQSAIATYRWTIPANTSIISAASDSSTINLSYNAGFNGGSISVKGQSACGITGTAKSLSLQYLTPTPTSITSSTGAYNFCIGTTATFTAVVPAPSATQRAAVVYRWTKPVNTSIISAATDSSFIVLQFNTGYNGGSVTVKGQTACGVQGTAKSQAITHTGCATGTKISTLIAVNTGLNDGQETVVNVFPNPGAGPFKVNVSGGELITGLRIMDLQGRVVFVKDNILKNTMTIGEGLTSGAYWLEVQTKYKRTVVKLIKE